MFKTQAEVLEYLGKNPNDRSLIQRMLCRGELVKKSDGYELLDKDRVIEEQENKIKELQRKLLDTALGESSSSVSEEDRDEYLKEIKELEGQLAESQIKQEQLEQRNAYLEEKMNGTEDIKDGEDKSSSNELEEAKIQREYYQNKANKYKEAINKVIEVTYSRIKPALGSRIGTLAEFRVNILEEVSDLIRE